MTSRATVTTTMSMRQAVTNEVSVCSLATRWKVLGSEGLGRNPHGAHAHLLTQPGHLCRACGVADAGRAQRDGLEAAGGCGRVRGGQPRKRNVPRKRMMSVFVHVCFMFSYNSQYSEKQGTSATRPTTPPRTTPPEGSQAHTSPAASCGGACTERGVRALKSRPDTCKNCNTGHGATGGRKRGGVG